VPLPTLANWINYELVNPEQRGRGRRGHVIGVNGLLELLAVIELRQVGFSLQEIRRAVENMRTLSGQTRPLAQVTVVVTGKDITWQDSEEISMTAVSSLRKPGQTLMIFPIGEKHAKLLHELEEGQLPSILPISRELSIADSEATGNHVA
jgi:DNA-binding transcriptional MerR regulator